MQVIPIQPVPSQYFTIVLDQEICLINLYVRGLFLYFDLTVGDTSITTATICLNADPLVKQQYLGFTANFLIIDTAGTSDPFYLGLGTRFLLIYFSAGELELILQKTT